MSKLKELTWEHHKKEKKNEQIKRINLGTS
jgi:hypothetical protein